MIENFPDAKLNWTKLKPLLFLLNEMDIEACDLFHAASINFFIGSRPPYRNT